MARCAAVPNVRLQPLSEQHLDALAAIAEDPAVLRFTRVPDPPPPGFARHWLGVYEEGRETGSREAFAALDAEGAFVGVGVAPEIDQEGRQAELGYVVAPAARGRGVATEILRQLTDWALDELGMLRVYLIVDVENPASNRVAERCGYVREGVMRSFHVKQGRRSDVVLWSRLPGD
jgi:RimJ/RimL family protein N-acetyltransferase